MNWIGQIDDMLAEIEGTVKGYEGDVITKVRGIINKNISGKSFNIIKEKVDFERMIRESKTPKV